MSIDQLTQQLADEEQALQDYHAGAQAQIDQMAQQIEGFRQQAQAEIFRREGRVAMLREMIRSAGSVAEAVAHG